MDKSSGLQSLMILVQAWVIGLSNWFISALPTVILIMSAALTGLQLYVFIRDKLRKKEI